MKKTSRFFSLLLSAAMLLSLLAGCGGGSTASPSAAPGGTESSAPAESSAGADLLAGIRDGSVPEDSTGAKDGGTITVALDAAISAKTMDPLYLDSLSGDQVMQNIGDTMVRLSQDGTEYLPCIAESWEISDDGLTYTFHIRNDVYFHPSDFQDGRQLTAADVEYTLERAVGYWCNYLYFLEDVEVVDDFTAVAHLSEPNATFLYELTGSSTIMVCKEDVEGYGDDYGLHVTSTGPFIMTEHVPDQYTTLVRNENYWGEKAHLEGVKYVVMTDADQQLNALKSGEIDAALQVTGTRVEEVLKTDGLEMYQSSAPRISFVGFNTKAEYLSDERVREALIMAVDYDQLQKGTFMYGEGETIRLPLTNRSWAYDESLEDLVPAYDPEGAKALLAEAGYANGFSIEMTCLTSETHMRIATILQQFWKQIGVDLVINQTQQAVLMESIQTGAFDVFIRSQGGSSDPATFTGYFYSSDKIGTNYNAWGYSDPAADTLIKQAIASTDQAERAELYKQLMELAVPADVGIFFVNEKTSWAINSRVHGVLQQGRTANFYLDSGLTNVWVD